LEKEMIEWRAGRACGRARGYNKVVNKKGRVSRTFSMTSGRSGDKGGRE